jgi:hypothetical protein
MGIDYLAAFGIDERILILLKHCSRLILPPQYMDDGSSKDDRAVSLLPSRCSVEIINWVFEMFESAANRNERFLVRA